MSEISNKPLFKCTCGAVYARNAFTNGDKHHGNSIADEHPLDRLAQAGLARAAAKWERGDMEARSKYHREIKPGVWVDVYDVLVAWAVDNPALQHLIKKALAPGSRGHKDIETDLREILASAERAIQLEGFE